MEDTPLSVAALPDRRGDAPALTRTGLRTDRLLRGERPKKPASPSDSCLIPRPDCCTILRWSSGFSPACGASALVSVGRHGDRRLRARREARRVGPSVREPTGDVGKRGFFHATLGITGVVMGFKSKAAWSLLCAFTLALPTVSAKRHSWLAAVFHVTTFRPRCTMCRRRRVGSSWLGT